MARIIPNTNNVGINAKRVQPVDQKMTATKLTRLNSKLQHLRHSSTVLKFSTTASPNPNPSSKEQTLLSLFKKSTTMNQIAQLHSTIIRSGFAQNLLLIGKVLNFCAVSDTGDMCYASRVFRELESPDGFMWNTMIRGFGRCGDAAKAFEWFGRMRERDVVVDNFTFCFLLKVCVGLGSEGIFLGKKLHCCVVRYGLDSHVFVRNCLIHVYGVFGEIDVARQLFDEIPEPELVAWNSLIDCYVSCGQFKEGIKLFETMLQREIEPDEASLVITLSACSAVGALDFGKWVHSIVDEKGLGGVVPVCNSLIDMYAKCGAVDEAMRFFDQMKGRRNIVSWNTMIAGMAMHGHGDQALSLYSNMISENQFTPNELTFLGVLCACNHKGLVEQGKFYFNSMVKDYKLKPTIKHYGCMVDILGRAGFVKEAYELIQSMPVECNAIVWRTLLAACRVHGQVELGEMVRKELLKIEPDHSSDYVLIASMYGDAEQWSQMATVRKSMRNRRVQKLEPGSSSMLRAIV